MSKNFQYITLDRIISKIYRDLGIEEISETDIVEWSGEALEDIGEVSIYEETVAFLDVKNHQADIPVGLHSIIQIAKNRFPEKKNTNTCTCGGSDCNHLSGGTLIDCKGTPSYCGVEIAYYRPYYDLKYEYELWSRSCLYRNHYVPVRLATHTFFNSIVCKEDEHLYRSCVDEYTIVGNKLRFSFKEGLIAISYNKQVIDKETGYPMIPEDNSIIKAITMYITMKYMGRLYYMGRDGYADKFQKAEQDWQWYCKQATNNSMIISGIDEYQNLLEGRKQLIPNHNKYYGFFGNLGRQQHPIPNNTLRYR